MGWGRIDDRFDDHQKVIDLLEYEQGASAVGLWTLCFTWAHRNTRKPGKTPGLIPASLPRRYVGPIARELAGMLVKVGLWEDRGEHGWQFHDFDQYLPTEHTREARAEAGRKGAEKRWAAKRGSKKQTDSKLPSEHDRLPGIGDNEPEASYGADSNAVANDGSRTPARRAISKEIAPVPEPVQPSAAANPQDDAGTLTITQRARHITDAYAAATPMCKWPAVNAIVIRAIKADKWDDGAIQDALLRHAADNRPVTIDSLRTELDGLPPPRRPSTTDRAMADAQAVKAKLAARRQEQP